MSRTTLLLDAAGTLFDLKPTLEVRLSTAFGPARISTSQQVLAAIERANSIGTWPEDQTDPDTRVAVWTTFVHGLLADIPAYEPTQDRHAATAAHIAAHIVDPASYVATTGAAELLLAARDAGVRCAVVSNFDHLLLDILSELRFLPLVDGITFSGELGFYKPDRRVFDTALRALNAAPGDSLMVGDSAYSDVNGARAAGIDAVLFDPHGRAVDHDGPRIQHLMDALNFL